MLAALKYALPFAGLLGLQPVEAQSLGPPFWETYVTLSRGASRSALTARRG
jgi:hypothetical protein